MSSSQVEEVIQIWKCNEELWNTRIEPHVLAPVEQAGGVKTPGPWENVVATAFGRSLQTFQSVQLLCKPGKSPPLWADAFILTRVLFETFVTLEWLDLDREPRLTLFEDEYLLKLAHMYEQLGELKEQVEAERRDGILRGKEDVIKRRGCGPNTLRLIPSLQNRVTEVRDKLGKRYPHLKSQYENYYRDVSGMAHPSAWGLVCSLSDVSPTVQSVEPLPQIGFKAVFCNGGWFFSVLRCWNNVFQVVPKESVEQWLKEWTSKSTVSGASAEASRPTSSADESNHGGS